MKLNKITISNFLSIKEATVEFDKMHPLVYIKGVNKDTKPHSSNGAGKSSIIEAISFVLFGKTLRKTNDKTLANNKTVGLCKVSLVVNDTIEIERTKRPPKLTVTIEGKSATQESVAATQQYLEKILNINFHVFMASMVFGQENSVNFLTATPEEKRSIIQNFLSVSEVFRNRGTIKSLKSNFLAEKNLHITLLNDKNSQIQKAKEKIKSLKSFTGDTNKMLREKKLAGKSFSEIQEQERTRMEGDVEIERLGARIDLLTERGEFSQQKSNRALSSACEACGHLKQKDLQAKTLADQEILDTAKELAGHKKQLTLLLKEKQPAVLTSVELFAIEKLYKSQAEVSLLTEQVKEAEAKAVSYGEVASKAQRQYDIMKFWESAFSETGLIRYVIRNILEYLNFRCNFYMNLLSNGNLAINFDETLVETIYNKEAPVSYDSMSGGEKRRSSLSVMLGLNDLFLLSGKDQANLLFFDEIADSLDAEGIKSILKLVNYIMKSKRLCVITHNENLINTLDEYAEPLLVFKRDGISVIKQTYKKPRGRLDNV